MDDTHIIRLYNKETNEPSVIILVDDEGWAYYKEHGKIQLHTVRVWMDARCLKYCTFD